MVVYANDKVKKGEKRKTALYEMCIPSWSKTEKIFVLTTPNGGYVWNNCFCDEKQT